MRTLSSPTSYSLVPCPCSPLLRSLAHLKVPRGVRITSRTVSRPGMSANHSSDPGDTSQDMPVISLATLPYDLLLNIARHLELLDIIAIQQVSSNFLSHSANCIGYANICLRTSQTLSRGLLAHLLCPLVPRTGFGWTCESGEWPYARICGV